MERPFLKGCLLGGALTLTALVGTCAVGGKVMYDAIQEELDRERQELALEPSQELLDSVTVVSEELDVPLDSIVYQTSPVNNAFATNRYVGIQVGPGGEYGLLRTCGPASNIRIMATHELAHIVDMQTNVWPKLEIDPLVSESSVLEEHPMTPLYENAKMADITHLFAEGLYAPCDRHMGHPDDNVLEFVASVSTMVTIGYQDWLRESPIYRRLQPHQRRTVEDVLGYGEAYLNLKR